MVARVYRVGLKASSIVFESVVGFDTVGFVLANYVWRVLMSDAV